jgi:translation initiation factor 3 subunit A
LTVLHEHVTSKRTRSSPIASLEPVMLLFVELSVDLRKGKAAKDGLYQYKNIAQNTNVGTIEVRVDHSTEEKKSCSGTNLGNFSSLQIVLKKFIELAEQKVTEAQAKADEIQSSLESAAPSANVEDLEAIETPETILLATVSGEQSRDRTDRAVVTPWLKFLWETYRTVLEILKNNARLEIMYQSTALQAFKFCQKYTRKTEFRRLCELLRNHVQNAAKYSSQMHAINLSDADTLQRHLDTRFQQLNVAVELELWQEAFRSIEDIHTLLNLSKRPAKNIMMANYYEKLARIFLVSENYLFHAAAYNRYYNLLRLSSAALASGQSSKKENPSVTEAEMTKAASFVFLSALSIPVISTSRSRGALVDVDEARKNKNTRLTNLLGMATSPTRTVLFRDALNKGLLRRVRPEIRELYNILEVDFHPLSICKKITPILTKIGADPEMEKYIVPLQQVILTRLFQQLSQVYESVELKFVYELAQFPDPFQITPAMIEKFIMNGCKKGDLAIRVDHISGVLTFDSDIFSSSKAMHAGSGAGSAESDVGSVQRLQHTPAEIARFQVARLAKTLHISCMYVDPSYNEARLQAKQTAQARAIAGAAQEHEETLARRVLIDKKKEAATDALQRKQREEETRKRQRAHQLQEAEKQRLADEQRDRELKRIKDEQDRIRQEELKKQIEELKTGVKGIDISELDLDELDANRLRAMKLAQLEKEKNELNDRIRTTAKRIDHLERAFRREELKHISDDYEAQKKVDRELYDKQNALALQESKEKHAEAVALKHRLGRLVPHFSNFRKEVSEKRHEEFEKRRKAAEREYEAKKKQRVKEVQERRRLEKQQREEEERNRLEEEERAAREEQERIAREEERRRVMAEEKAKRDEERSFVIPEPKITSYYGTNLAIRKMDEIAIKQRQREEEAEARLAARKGGFGDSSERPRINIAPRTGAPPSTWRERQAAKEAGGAPAESAPTREEPAPARKIGGGYVPPHLRAGASASSGSAPPPPAPREAPTERWAPREPRESAPREAPTERWAPRQPRESSSQSPAPSSKPEESKPAAGGKWVPKWKQQQ